MAKSVQVWMDEHFPKENRSQIKELDLIQKNLTGHLDLRDFINLRKLNVRENDITSIDLSRCVDINDCVLNRNPKLSKIDISNNSKIKSLLIYLCEIKELDLSKNPNLEVLITTSAPIERIDVTHNPKLKTLLASFCPELKRIIGVKNKKRLNEINFPETSLDELDLSNCSQLYHLTLPNCRKLKKLNISGCTDLRYLIVEGSIELAELDLSDNPNLIMLSVADTSLTSLDLSKNRLKPHYLQLVEEQMKENKARLQKEALVNRSWWKRPSSYLVFLGGTLLAFLLCLLMWKVLGKLKKSRASRKKNPGTTRTRSQGERKTSQN